MARTILPFVLASCACSGSVQPQTCTSSIAGTYVIDMQPFPAFAGAYGGCPSASNVTLTLTSNGKGSVVGAPNLLQRGLPGPFDWAGCTGRVESPAAVCPETIDVVCGPSEQPTDGGVAYNVAFHMVLSGQQLVACFPDDSGSALCDQTTSFSTYAADGAVGTTEAMCYWGLTGARSI